MDECTLQKEIRQAALEKLAAEGTLVSHKLLHRLSSGIPHNIDPEHLIWCTVEEAKEDESVSAPSAQERMDIRGFLGQAQSKEQITAQAQAIYWFSRADTNALNDIIRDYTADASSPQKLEKKLQSSAALPFHIETLYHSELERVPANIKQTINVEEALRVIENAVKAALWGNISLTPIQDRYDLDVNKLLADTLYTPQQLAYMQLDEEIGTQLRAMGYTADQIDDIYTYFECEAGFIDETDLTPEEQDTAKNALQNVASLKDKLLDRESLKGKESTLIALCKDDKLHFNETQQTVQVTANDNQLGKLQTARRELADAYFKSGVCEGEETAKLRVAKLEQTTIQLIEAAIGSPSAQRRFG